MLLQTPATSANLSAGFDCLGLCLELFNEVKIKPSNFFKLSISGYGSDKFWFKKNNTFVNIFNEQYFQLTGNKKNYSFSFYNNIPLSRGLGSSSSVIIGALVGAYLMAGFEPNIDKILSLALEYEPHPDNITPAAVGGFVASVVNEKKVHFAKTEISDEVCAIICVPNKTMSTNKSRKALLKNVSLQDAVFNLSHSSLITASFFSKDYSKLEIFAKDKLHQTGRMKALPELFEVQKMAYENGALMASLSGSGSSFFIMSYKDKADFIKEKLEKTFVEFKFLKLNFNNYGYKIN